MNNNLKEILEKEINDLIENGEKLYLTFNYDEFTRNNYQVWFSKSNKIVELLLPERYQEFKEYYSTDKIQSYLDKIKIKLFLSGFFYEEKEAEKKSIKTLFSQQIAILKSCKEILNSKFNNIQYEMFIELNETELDTAKSLLKINLRASGCIAGVVLEKYLKSLLNKYNPNHGKKDNELSLNVINELLKEKAYDIKTFRNIQYLSDIRNLCDHDKKDSEGKTIDPTKEDVETLIENTERIMRTIY